MAVLIIFFHTAVFAAPPQNALPTGGQVAAGTSSINTNGNKMDITQSSQKTVINWQTFNIGANAGVNFAQPNSSSIALNRVLSGGPSSIYGRMTANGQIFLLNPSGIIFGPTASVNVGGLVASTLSLKDSDFMNGNYKFYNAGGAGSIVNQGNITANDGGYIALLAPQVTNQGVVIARMGTVAIAAGDQVSLDFNGDGLINFAVDKGTVNAFIDNKNLIQADGGRVLMTAKAADNLSSAVVNNEGVIQAQTIGNRNGVIMLMGDMQNGTVHVSGTLDASAPNGGDGGFIETSAAKVQIVDTARVTTRASYGKTGQWLIDPADFTIAPSGGDMTGAQLASNLELNNVTIRSSMGTVNLNGGGDINVNDSITWDTSNTLTLSAYRNINISRPLFNSGGGGVVLTTGHWDWNAPFNPNDPCFLPGGCGIYVTGPGHLTLGYSGHYDFTTVMGGPMPDDSFVTWLPPGSSLTPSSSNPAANNPGSNQNNSPSPSSSSTTETSIANNVGSTISNQILRTLAADNNMSQTDTPQFHTLASSADNMNSVATNENLPVQASTMPDRPASLANNSGPADQANPKICPFGSTANVITGNLSHSQTLFSVANSRLINDFELTYNSMDNRDIPLGKGWTHSFNITLVKQMTLTKQGNSTSYVLTYGDGERLTLNQNGERYTPDFASYPTLSLNVDGTATVENKNGTFYDFSPDGRLVLVRDRNDDKVTLKYTAGNLTGIADPSGRTIAISFKGSRISLITDPNGNSHSFTYTANTLASVSSNIVGMGIRNWSYSYLSGLLSAKTDPLGNTTTYAYDSQNRTISATDPLGRIRRVTYRPDGKTAQITEKDGGVWSYSFDPAIGLLSSKTDPYGNTTRFAFDSNKNIAAVTDPNNHTTRYSYDSRENVTSVTDAMGNKTSITYNSLNKITSVTDPAGNTSRITHDAKGNILTVTDPTGAVTRYAHDQYGNLTGITDALGRKTTIAYTPQRYLASITKPSGATVTYGHDTSGRITSYTDALGHVVKYTYNGLNLVTSITDPEGHVTLIAYDKNSNRISVTDANGKTTLYAHNYAGKVTTITDANGGTTTLAYGSNSCPACGGREDKLSAVTDAKGNKSTFTHDKAGRLTRETDPAGHYKSYTHDAVGDVTSVTDEMGRTTNIAYDGLNRATVITYPDATTKRLSYDSMSHITGAANSNIGYTITYDSLARITGVTDTFGRNIQYAHDNTGRRTQMIIPDGRALSYGYTEDSLLSHIDAWGKDIRFSYDAADRRTSMAYPNGVMTSYDRNPEGWLTGVTAVHDGIKINQVSYKHDSVGNGLSMADAAGIHLYTYDHIYQLLTARHPNMPTENYAYDGVGNRRGYTVNGLNQVINDGILSYSYADSGNMSTRSDGVTFGWDYDNLLTRVTLPDGRIVTYKHDPFGRRIERDCTGPCVDPGITRYSYDGPNVLVTYDGNNNKKDVVVHGLSIDDQLLLEKDGNAYYFHKDALISVNKLTDMSGNIVFGANYDSFGNPSFQTTLVKTDYTYTGREYDEDTGLYYYRARWYDAHLGRFISKDPIGLAGADVNLYAYAGGNPVNMIDPFGLWTVAFGGSAGAGGGGGGSGSVTVVVDGHGNIGFMESPAGGGMGGVGYTRGGGTVQVTDADTIYDLRGWSSQTGGSYGEGISYGAEWVTGSGYNGLNINVGAGGGLIPAELHSYMSYSFLQGTNNKDLLQAVVNFANRNLNSKTARNVNCSH